jgi:hypothetical protein
MLFSFQNPNLEQSQMHTNAFSKAILHAKNPKSWKAAIKQDAENL